jgi:GH25 family lysozyme M1 (1,4-beta-N-acetylmuramidase)
MTLTILDTSANNTVTSWPALLAAGIDGAICKASEGMGYRDPELDASWTALAAAGRCRGAYHFARPALGTAARDEAAYFLASLPPLAPADVLALDIEDDPSGQPPPAGIAAWVLTWMQTVEQAVGFRPWLYSSVSFIQTYLARTPELGQYPLWLAAPGAEAPAVPGPWPVLTMWQWTWTASWPGISGDVDQSVFYGERTTWAKLGKPTPAPTRVVTDPHPPRIVTAWRVTTAQWLRAQPDAASARLIDAPVGAVLPVVGPPTPSWANVSYQGVHGWLLQRNGTPLYGS